MPIILEVSLTVQDFIISVNGSSCNYLFSGLLFSSLFSFSIYVRLGIPFCLGNVIKETEKRSENEAERGNYMNCRTQKC